MSAKKKYRPTLYYLLLGPTIILTLLGLVMILNASSVQAYSGLGDAYYYLKRQLIWIIIGFLAMFAFSRLNYRSVVKQAPFFILFAIASLLLLRVPGIGQTVKGAASSVVIGPYNFQPSEPAKLAVIVYLAGILCARRREVENLRNFAFEGGVIFAVLALVVLQPDLGTALVIAVSVITMLFLGGARKRDVFGLTAASAAAAAAFIMSAPFRRDRIFAFLNPGADPEGIGYQIRQSLIALGSGGLTGVGLGMSRQKFFFLPESHTDFIFAIIGEELGLLGCLLVVAAFGLIVYAGLKTAFKTKDYLGKILGAGITAAIAGQAFINLGAATGMLPVTGIPLPLVSFGGSSLLATMSMLGILMNIASGESRGVSTDKTAESDGERRRNGRSRISRTRAAESAISR